MKATIILILAIATIQCNSINQECPDIPEQIVSYFPKDFFVQSPNIKTLENDTVEITLILNQHDWHMVYYSSISNRINHLLDSLECYEVKKKLDQSKLIYNMYNKVTSKETLMSYVESGDRGLISWKYPKYRELNKLILNLNPEVFIIYDEMLNQYYSETENSEFEISFFDVYSGIVGNRKLKNSDFLVLDSLISRSYRNQSIIDPLIIVKMKELAPAIPLEMDEELIIEDQIPDKN